MAQEDPAAEVRRLAKAESARRERLAADAAKQLGVLRGMAAKLEQQAGVYAEAFKAAIDAWGPEQMAAFGLVTPEQAAIVPDGKATAKRRPAAGREPA